MKVLKKLVNLFFFFKYVPAILLYYTYITFNTNKQALGMRTHSVPAGSSAYLTCKSGTYCPTVQALELKFYKMHHLEFLN